jgi:hypothetical protein
VAPWLYVAGAPERTRDGLNPSRTIRRAHVRIRASGEQTAYHALEAQTTDRAGLFAAGHSIGAGSVRSVAAFARLGALRDRGVEPFPTCASRADCSILWMRIGGQRLNGLLGDVCWRIDHSYCARAKA